MILRNIVLAAALLVVIVSHASVSTAQTPVRTGYVVRNPTYTRAVGPATLEVVGPNQVRVSLRLGSGTAETVYLEASKFTVQQERGGTAFETADPVTVSGSASDSKALWRHGVKVVVQSDGQVRWYVKSGDR